MNETMALLLKLQFGAENAASDVISAIANDLNGLGGEAGKAAKALAAMGPAMMALAAGAAAAGAALIVATKAAADFQTQLSRAEANTTLTTKETVAMGDAILQMSQQSGMSLSDLGAGYVHVSNIMNDTTTAVNVLNVAQESAASTGGSVASYAQTLARVLHEFAMSGSEAAAAMDMLHTAAAAGDLTLEQFTANSGNALAMAANYKVPLDQVSAAYIALTKHGMDAADANTQMADQFLRLTTVTPKVETELKRVSQLTGVDLVGDFTSAGLASKGLTGIYADLTDAENKMGMSSEAAFAENMLLGDSLRGGRGLAILAGNGLTDYTAILGQVDDATASAAKRQDDYNRYLQTTAGEMDQLKAMALALAIAFGGPLNDAFGALLSDIVGTIQEFQALNDKIFQMTAFFRNWVISTGAIGTALEGVDTSTDNLVSVQHNLELQMYATAGAARAEEMAITDGLSGAMASANEQSASMATQAEAIAAQDKARAEAIKQLVKDTAKANVDAWHDAISTVTDQLATATAADKVMAEQSHSAALATIQANADASKMALADEVKNYNDAMDAEIKARREQQVANDKELQIEAATATASENSRYNDVVAGYAAQKVAADTYYSIVTDHINQEVTDATNAERQRVEAATDATNATIQNLQNEKQAFDNTIAEEIQARQNQYTMDVRILDATTKAQLAAIKGQEDALRREYDYRKQEQQVGGKEGKPAEALLRQYHDLLDAGNVTGAEAIATKLSGIDQNLADMMAQDQLNRQEAALQSQATSIQDQANAQKQSMGDELAAFKEMEADKKAASDAWFAAEIEMWRGQLAAYKDDQAAHLAAYKVTEQQKQDTATFNHKQALAIIAGDDIIAKRAHDAQLAAIKLAEDNKRSVDAAQAAADLAKLQADKTAQDAVYAASETARAKLYTEQTAAANVTYKDETDGIDAVAREHQKQLQQMANDANTWSGSETAAIDAVTSALDAMNGALNGQAAAQTALNAAQAASGTGMQYGTGNAGGTGGGIPAPGGGPAQHDGSNDARGQQILANAQAMTGDQSYDGWCEAFAERVSGVGNMGGSARGAWGNWGKGQQTGMPDKVGDLVYFGYGADGHVGVYAGGGQFTSALDSPWGVTTMSMSAYEQANNAPYLGYVQPFYNGGWINEPIMGVGASGQRYSFGEKGREYVSPDGKTGSVNVYITGNYLLSNRDLEELASKVGRVIVRQTGASISLIR